MSGYLQNAQFRVDLNTASNDEVANIIIQMVKTDGFYERLGESAMKLAINSEDFANLKKQIDEEIRVYLEGVKFRHGLNKFRVREELMEHLSAHEELQKATDVIIRTFLDTLKDEMGQICSKYSARIFKKSTS